MARLWGPHAGPRKSSAWLSACCLLHLCFSRGWGCIIFDTAAAGFAVNVRILAGTAAYFELNGTLYVDERSWAYKCEHTSHVGTVDMGWPLLFRGASPQPVPVKGAESCTRVNFDTMLNIFQNIHTGHTEEAGATAHLEQSTTMLI